jgi:arylsulfatase A-like enzyme/Tfp pilus assembly protein PilF
MEAWYKKRRPRRRARWWLLSLGLLALASAALYFENRGTPRSFRLRASPNVLLISIDTLRADHLGAYASRAVTPHLDRLASSGVVFENAVAHVPVTLPSHASLLTGTYPFRHGVRDNGSFRLAEDRETLAESFRAGGYRTAAFVGAFPLDSRFGLDQGFELYDDAYGEASEYDFAISERTAEAVLGAASRWLESVRREKWFALVHLYDPHVPYAPPEPFATAYASAAYAGEVAYVDDALGRFFEKCRPFFDNVLTVVTSDHGEGLGDHGEKTHGMFAYESTLRVPLIFHRSGALAEGARVPTRVRLIDVAPTILELGQIPTDGGFDGLSLLPLMKDPASGAPRESYFEALSFHLTRNWAPLYGVYREELKYIDLPVPELYDLKADPGETANLVASKPRLAEQMARVLGADFPARLDGTAAPVDVDPDTEARLAALGYAVAPMTGPKSARFTADDDPKNLAHLTDRLDEARNLHLAGRAPEAVELFREILRQRPTFTRAYVTLAYALHDQGELSGAIAVLERARALGLGDPSVAALLGAYLEEAGKLDASAAVLESAVAQEPTNVEAINFLAVTYARRGEHEKALAALERLLGIDPSFAGAYANRGSLYLEQRRYAEAEASFRRALELDPGLASAWNGLGVACAITGREREAIEAWKRAIALAPGDPDTVLNLGVLLERQHLTAEARLYLEEFLRVAPAASYRKERARVERLLKQ